MTKHKELAFSFGLFLIALGIVSGSLAFISKMANSAVGACGLSSDTIGSFVLVEGGGFIQGLNGIYPEEGPAKKVYVSPFLIQINEVTNQQFADFVAATGYVTEAQRFGGSANFTESGSLSSPLSWWLLDKDATWNAPEGKNSNLDGREHHPVIHITLNDARSYAKWAGGRIPNEVEWEYAASLGLFDPEDPESGIHAPNGEARANIWHGLFPVVNTEDDGFKGTAPVGCYEESLIGTYDMIGNVWEWTESRFDSAKPVFTIKGGSYLCGSNYCRRFRPTAREHLEPNFSTAHVGFRIVKDLSSTHDGYQD